VLRWVAGLSIVIAIATAPMRPAGAVTGPVKILAGPEDQSSPSVNAAYLVWTQNSVAHPTRDHAYGRTPVLGATGRFRMDAPGTRGSAGGIDPLRNRAIYQQMTSSTSDLYWFNFDTRKRSKLPAPVNTAKWERDPRVSATYVLFARDTRSEVALFLWRRGAPTLRKIASYAFATSFVAPGGVGDRYATWTVCGPLNCSAHVYDADTDTTMEIPTLQDRPQYAPVVDESRSIVYFVRSHQGCGDTVGIWRRPLDLSAPGTRLVLLPAGIDTGWTLSLDDDVAHPRLDLWFARFRCGPRQGDLYELRDVGA
jgi:hypothetical protein